MSITYYWSGGNIVMLALIHGVFDATAFLGVATTSQIGQAAQLAMVFVGIGFAAVYLPQKINMRQTPNPQGPTETKLETQPPPTSVAVR